MRPHQLDETLARGAAQGNLDNFEELLRRHRPRVYRICYRLAGNTEDAEDWTQECFLRIYGQLHLYNPARPFSPWMLRVVSTTCINKAKARTLHRDRLVPELNDEIAVPTDTNDPAYRLLEGEEKRRVNAAVALLPPLLRQAVVLRVQEELSFRELADILQVPLQTAASRVRQALLQVRARLEKSESEIKHEM